MTLPSIIPLSAWVAETVPLLRPVFKSAYGMVPWEALDQPGPEISYLIDDFLTSGGKSIIGGPSMSGKSFLAIHAGMSIARGTPFFGHKAKRGLVVYQAGEGAIGIKNRLRAYREFFEVPADERVPFVLLQKRVDLYSPEGDTKGLIAEVNGISALYDMPVAALFIDTLSRASGAADENNGKDMGAILNNVDAIQDATKAHVCLVHHLNADGTKLRGHTSVFANVDQVLSVVCDKESKVRTLSLAKQKDDTTDVSIKFELKAIEVGKRDDGRDVTSCVVLPLGEKDALKAEDKKRSHFGTANERAFMHALLKVVDESGFDPPPGTAGIPLTITRVCDYNDIKASLRSSAVSMDDDAEKADNRVRQAARRAAESLRDAGVIGVLNVGGGGKSVTLMWWTGRVVSGIPKTYPRRANSQPKRADNDDAGEDLPFAL